MLKTKLFKTNSMAFAVVGAVVILLLVSLFPMNTSLAQGIDEGIVAGWKGVYDPTDHLYNLRFLYQDGTYADYPLPALPLSDFRDRSSVTLWTTQMDFLPALQASYQANASKIQYELGTRGNVATFANPFPGNPIAYTVGFLRDLERLHVNPKSFGGPDIPPGSVPYSKVTGGVLQIDTQSNGNTIIQLQPGQVPPVLKYLNPTAVS